jgi:hypothetical protein
MLFSVLLKTGRDLTPNILLFSERNVHKYKVLSKYTKEITMSALQSQKELECNTH